MLIDSRDRFLSALLLQLYEVLSGAFGGFAEHFLALFILYLCVCVCERERECVCVCIAVYIVLYMCFLLVGKAVLAHCSASSSTSYIFHPCIFIQMSVSDLC